MDDPLYDAFRRFDSYGDLGRKRQPWPETLRLIVMACTLVPLKFLGCVYFVVAFYLVCRYIRSRRARRNYCIVLESNTRRNNPSSASRAELSLHLNTTHCRQEEQN